MRERHAGDRLRIAIAGDVYAKRALVRRFLEDDGFEVVAETTSRHALFARTDLDTVDAVVVDAELFDGSMGEIRSRAPDAAVVVFTSPGGPTGTPAGADAYLEKGMGLATLTALLHTLLSEAPAPAEVATAVALRPPVSERRVLAGLAGTIAALVVGAVVALAVFGPSASVPVSSPIVGEASPPPAFSTGRTVLDLAGDRFEALQSALAAGHLVQAATLAQRLRDELSAARAHGFSVSPLVDELRSFLHPMLGDLRPSFVDQLRGFLGDFVSIPVLTVTNKGSTPSGGGAGPIASSQTVTPSDSGGGGSRGGGSGGGGGGNGGGGGHGPQPSPGGGHHYGWSHKPPSGGWHGTKPHPTGHGHSKHPKMK